ncbi:MAG: hypothetical protein HY455_01640 [Parcubacteria group bacterium]|nr:hypothetical protein [Parcubacteria group bacterium]
MRRRRVPRKTSLLLARVVVGATFALHAGIIIPAPVLPAQMVAMESGRMSLYVPPFLSYEDVFGARVAPKVVAATQEESEDASETVSKKTPEKPSVVAEKPKPKVVPLVNLAAPQAIEVVAPPPPQAVALPTDENGPDFVLSAFSHYGAPIDEGQAPSLSVIVTNKGKSKTEEKIRVQFFVDKDSNGTRDVAFSAQESRPLDINDQETLIWKNAWTLVSGTHRLEVCADVLNLVVEINEDNNCVSMILEVGSKMDNADLVVSAASYAPTNPTPGMSVSFFAEIANQGKKTSTTQYVSLLINGVITGRTGIASIPVGGEGKTVEWKTVWKAVAGTHTYDICADSTNRIHEPNEDNNCAKGTFVVTP